MTADRCVLLLLYVVVAATATVAFSAEVEQKVTQRELKKVFVGGGLYNHENNL